MELPESSDVDVSRLARVFADKTNSYKFYWFLAILDSLKENDQSVIVLKDIALRMVANVWYPLDFFKLSFGKQDRFKAIADLVSTRVTVDNSKNSPPLFDQLKAKLSQEDLHIVYGMVNERVRYVPYRFVRPFLDELIVVEDKGDNIKNAVINFSNNLFKSDSKRVMYRFLKDSIEISDTWKAYLQRHQGILRGFTYWHLLQFLQKNNPNVIGLPDKLFKRADRDFKIASSFWNTYLQANSGLVCIYSGQAITKQNISLDHFLPWSYVVHDQIWNIIPTTRQVNSAKNDALPSIDLYFENYSQLQFAGFQFHAQNSPKKFLEDYSILFNQSIGDIYSQPFEYFREGLKRTILPQLQMAQNLGFSYPFKCPEHLKQ